MIKVGAATEVELKEKKHRIEDAVSATKAAVEEGIVAGGGVALLQAQEALDKVDLGGDELTGVDTRLRRSWRQSRRRRRTCMESPGTWTSSPELSEGLPEKRTVCSHPIRVRRVPSCLHDAWVANGASEKNRAEVEMWLRWAGIESHQRDQLDVQILELPPSAGLPVGFRRRRPLARSAAPSWEIRPVPCFAGFI